MDKYIITKEQAEKILAYLSTCPYGQVYELAEILRSGLIAHTEQAPALAVVK